MSIDFLPLAFDKYFAGNNLLGILILCIACFILAGLLRMIFGKKGVTVKAVSAVLDLMILYCAVLVLYLQVPAFSNYLTTLPFLAFFDDRIVLMSILDADRLTLCINLIHLVILTFLFGLLEDLLPQGKNLIVWILLRLLSIVIVYIGFGVLCWASNAFLPGFLITYAPTILLALLAVFLAVTVFRWLFGLLLGITGGPIIGAIYTFFISNIVGKQLTKAALSCGLLWGIVYFLNYRGFTILYFDDLSTAILILSIVIPVTARYFISKLF